MPVLLAVAARVEAGLPFVDETPARLAADPALGALDLEEKDYVWGDVDGDGDDDLVVVRKQPFSTSGRRPNVLLLNEGGVLTDRTAEYASAADDGGQGFLDSTNDRDVQLVDLTGDGRLDIVTAVACYGNCAALPKTITHPRVYVNLGSDGDGNWLGFRYEGGRIPQFPQAPNFTAVAAGDVTGDGFPDLYFTDSISTLEDRLLINAGDANPGHFTDESAARMMPQMLASSFGTSAVIADMNGDLCNDVVKSENGPVEILYNAGGGFFNTLDPVSTSAHYHVDAGDLNGDGMTDLIIVDEGLDRYLLNQGNDPEGLADFVTYTFPGGTNGFESNVLVADLDGNGWDDVIIPDVSVDAPGCTLITAILRNNADPPDVTFDVESTNIPSAMRQGVFDVAVLDIDGDGKKDLVLGRCTGTSVWIRTQVIEFTYPQALPLFVPSGQPANLEVHLEPFEDAIEPGSPTLHVSLNGGPFIQSALDRVGPDLYQGELPAAQCSDRLDFYFSAELSGGPLFVDPPGAPQETYGADVFELGAVVFADAIEADVSAWTIQSDPSLTTGEWEQADPNGTWLLGNEPAAPADDGTPDGTMAFVTENGPPGGLAQDSDVDNGPTWLFSPPVELAGADALVSFSAWVFSDLGVHDALNVDVSIDGGAWVPVAQITGTSGAWKPESFRVGSYLEPAGELRVRFGIADVPNDSVTEAGIDDFAVTELGCPGPCPADLDGSGDVGVIDLLALLAAWGTDPGGPPDLDGDGSVGVVDLLLLLAAWGACL